MLTTKTHTKTHESYTQNQDIIESYPLVSVPGQSSKVRIDSISISTLKLQEILNVLRN